jgi:hypothetical protein
MGQAAVRLCIWLFPVCLWGFPLKGNAQEWNDRPIADTDTLTVEMPDSVLRTMLIAADSVALHVAAVPLREAAFKPNPTKAVLWSLIPGMGQIYNRKYWKLPFVYGGFMGFMYAVTWNGKNYTDYWGAYQSIMTDAAAYNKQLQESNGANVDYEFSRAWTDFLPTADHQSAVNNVNYQNLFKNRKDYFRRNRDLSLILSVGFYLLCMVDAYVDAELFNFDISPDLSMRIEPMASPPTRFSERNIGLNCSITF